MRQFGRWLRCIPVLGAFACGDVAERPATLRQTDWAVDSLPFFDVASGAGDTIIGLAASVASARAGDFVLADRERRQLRYLSSAGATVRTVGRAGDRLGEFRSLSGLSRCGDSLHLLDIEHARWTVASLDGVAARTYPVAAPDGVAGRVPYAWDCNATGQFIHMEHPVPDAELSSGGRPQVEIWLSTAHGEVSATLGAFPGPEPRGVQATLQRVPVHQRTLVAIGATRAYVGLADSSRILTYRLDGTLLSTIPTPHLSRRATAGDGAGHRPPAHTAMLVDASDLLWVRGSPQDSARTVRWTVHDEIGNLVGEAYLPTALEVSEIGADFVLGIASQLVNGTPRVRAYRLRR